MGVPFMAVSVFLVESSIDAGSLIQE